MEFPVGPRQIGETQVSRGMRAEACHSSAECEGPDDFGPRPEGDGLRTVAPRLREEEEAAGRAQFAAVNQIGVQQRPRCRGVGHHPGSPSLRRLGAHPEGAIRGVQIVCAQAAELLPAQAGVVGKREHHVGQGMEQVHAWRRAALADLVEGKA